MDVSKERNTLLCLDTKHFFTFSHSICYRKQFQSILAKRNIHSFKHTIHVTQHNVSRHADSPEGENTAYETPRTSQETVNGMAWYCQKGMKYHKFSLFTNSQSKKCHNVSRRSDNSTRDCQWDGMVLSGDEISPQVFTVHKFTVKEVSASQRSAERPGSTKASDMGLGEEFVEPLHKVRAPRHHAETGIKQLLQALQVLLGHLKGDLLQTNGAVTHMQCYTKCKVTLSAMLH